MKRLILDNLELLREIEENTPDSSYTFAGLARKLNSCVDFSNDLKSIKQLVKYKVIVFGKTAYSVDRNRIKWIMQNA